MTCRMVSIIAIHTDELSLYISSIRKYTRDYLIFLSIETTVFQCVKRIKLEYGSSFDTKFTISFTIAFLLLNSYSCTFLQSLHGMFAIFQSTLHLEAKM